MLIPDSAVDSHDRLGFTLSLALAMHAALILGIGFAPQDPPAAAGQSRLEITLAQHRSEEAPKQADYLARHSQLASGTEKSQKDLTTTQQAEFVDTTIHEISQQQQLAGGAPQTQQQSTQISSTQSQFKIAARKVGQEARPRTADTQIDLIQNQREIASLEAKLDEQQQSLAKRPRIHRLTSVSTQASPEADYLYYWQQRIERIGNQHYPQEARRRQLYGDLRLLVAINSNGSLRDVKILQSSGHPVLDNAAIRIVRTAAPFDPFSPEIRKNTDVIEIIRTWQFKKNRLSSNS